MKKLKVNTIINGDALETLKTFPDESINCVMTSPPYWALRDYGIKGQIGLELTFEEHVNKMCNVFDEVKRVLRKDGTCWVNYGDSYISKGATRHKGYGDPKNPKRGKIDYDEPSGLPQSAPEKSLGMIPFRFAIEMVNRGWRLRNVIIWHKPNTMPQSAKDRFTVDFEYLFFFSKSKKYYFEQQFEKSVYPDDGRKTGMARQGKQYRDKARGKYKGKKKYGGGGTSFRGHSGYIKADGTSMWRPERNKRTVWKIKTKPFPEAHFAVYPEKLCITPIKAGCPPKGIVLDPFIGSGTTAVVARKLGRDYVGIELNPKYIKIAEKRLQQRILI